MRRYLVTASFLLPIAPAAAQDMPQAAPILEAPADIFLPTPLVIAGAQVEIGTNARLEYDSNIYAKAFGTKDDFKILVRPFINATHDGGTVQLTARAAGDFRRFFKYSKENANGGEVRGGINWVPSATDKVTFGGGWQHVIEERGEPEGRVITSIGPRQLNHVDTSLLYAHQGSRLGFSLRGTFDRYRYTQMVDERRNLDNYAIVGRVGSRITPLMNVFVEGFATKRDFAFGSAIAEFDRDSTTYGARAGIGIDPGGTLRGEAAAGIYRFDPKDLRIGRRNGLSAQASLVFQPRARTAFTLDAYTGNVATYSTGSQTRTDTRVTFGIQQEVRHDLRWQAGAVFRRSRFYGTGLSQNLYGGTGQIEYAVNRRIILAITGRFAKRTSDDPIEDFERFRGGLELKIHY